MKKVLWTLAIIALLIIGIGLFALPKQAQLERSIVINAPQQQIFDVLNGFEHFEQWSPWQDMDPNQTIHYSGPTTGVGAKMTWSGEVTGEGSQEVTVSNPPSEIRVLLDFVDQGTADTYFLLKPMEGGTEVTWGFDTELTGIIEPWIGLFMDSMVGSSYEQGLKSLKSYVEAMPEPTPEPTPSEVVVDDMPGFEMLVMDVLARNTLVAQGEARIDDAEGMSEVYAEVMNAVTTHMQENAISASGPALTRTHSWDEQAGVWRFEAGFVIDGEVAESDTVKMSSLPGGRVLRTVHIGPYEESPMVYAQTYSHIAELGEVPTEISWEYYMNSPEEVSAEELITHIFVKLQESSQES